MKPGKLQQHYDTYRVGDWLATPVNVQKKQRSRFTRPIEPVESTFATDETTVVGATNRPAGPTIYRPIAQLSIDTSNHAHATDLLTQLYPFIPAPLTTGEPHMLCEAATPFNDVFPQPNPTESPFQHQVRSTTSSLSFHQLAHIHNSSFDIEKPQVTMNPLFVSELNDTNPAIGYSFPSTAVSNPSAALDIASLLSPSTLSLLNYLSSNLLKSSTSSASQLELPSTSAVTVSFQQK